jgi:hypothetical protein
VGTVIAVGNSKGEAVLTRKQLLYFAQRKASRHRSGYRVVIEWQGEFLGQRYSSLTSYIHVYTMTQLEVRYTKRIMKLHSERCRMSVLYIHIPGVMFEP